MITRKSDITRVGMRKTAFCLLVFACLSTGSYAQELQQEEQQTQNGFSPREETTPPAQNPITIGGGMWGQQNPDQEANPQSNGTNSEDVNTDAEGTGGATAPSPGRGGIRRTTTVGGVTREAAGTNPAGNPDEVPFDDNMNLVFLISGMAFAFIIMRKKLMTNKTSVRS